MPPASLPTQPLPDAHATDIAVSGGGRATSLTSLQRFWERLAFDLLLYTGLRRGDAVRVGRQHERDGVITIRTEKHRKGKPGELVSIPILPPLAASIAATKTGDLTYLVTDAGQPWVKESFRTKNGPSADTGNGCSADRARCPIPSATTTPNR